MKNIKFFGLSTMMLIGTLFMTNNANAGRNHGNYIDSDGCLVVWDSYTFLGITWSYNSTKFCNSDGTAVNFQ